MRSNLALSELQVYDNKLEELALEAALDFAMSSTQ